MKVLYFGIYDPNFSRNRIYISGLRQNGVEVIECRDSSPGFRKYWRLWRKHRAVHDQYDALVVGYPGHLVVPLARMISKKPIIADLLGSLTDAEVNSRGAGLARRFKSEIADRPAVWFADVVLLESEAQKAYFIERFGESKKYKVLYTGADDSVFFCLRDHGAAPKDSFIVLFRGRLTPESGITYILEAARLLKDDARIRFRIIGFGQLLEEVKRIISCDSLTNVELIAELLPEDELRRKMCEASVSLGQFEDNPRLSRTIPHKAFESMAMGIPYVTGDALAVREVVTDEKTGFFVPLANPEALSEEIRSAAMNTERLKLISGAAYTLFKERFSSHSLGAELNRILSKK